MADVTVTVRDNGPFLIKGDVDLVDAEGNSFPSDQATIALCRCGASTKQPFCTGMHNELGFESAPRASEG